MLSRKAEDYLEAIRLNPSYATAHHWYSDLLRYVGRYEEALRQNKLSQELDPLSLMIKANEASVLYRARQYDQAINVLQNLLDMDANFAPAHLILGLVYLEKGMSQEAVTELEKAVALFGDSPQFRACLAMGYASAGMRDAALEILEELTSEATPLRYHVAIVFSALGDEDQAIAWLQ